MKLEVRGGTKEQRAYVRDIARWSALNTMSKRLYSTLNVKINLKPELMKKEGMYGDAIEDDDFKRHKNFKIRADADMKMKPLLMTIAHEMVHVKQWAKDEMRSIIKNGKPVTRFMKGYYDLGIDYWKSPWEIEAHGLEKMLFESWVDARQLTEDWTYDDLKANYPRGYWKKK